MIKRFKKWREARRERARHNDHDFWCIYWWGDRGGEAISVFDQRCSPCRDEVKYGCARHTHSWFHKCPNGLTFLGFLKSIK